MYGVYDYRVVIHTHTHARVRAHTTCDNLPREICDNLPQRNFFIRNRTIAAMFEILILLTSPRDRLKKTLFKII